LLAFFPQIQYLRISVGARAESLRDLRADRAFIVRLSAMPDIGSALKEEIARLARKEIRAQTESLKKANSQYRHQIAQLRVHIEQLERKVKRAVKAASLKIKERDTEGANLRFRADGFAQHRKRLGLSAREMGLLLDASALSVYKWENGQAKPAAKHLQAIASIRKMGKREATKRVQELAGAA
jgi:DNA-binding transcriptional regulator YiaG